MRKYTMTKWLMDSLSWQTYCMQRYAIRSCHVGCIGARSTAMMENARLAWCALSRSAVVAHQVRWWSAIRCQCEFRCNRPCGRKKNCGRHRCSELCCPLSRKFAQLEDGDWDPHLCQISCGKKLRCGQHSCQLLCHSGHCPPCLETIFTDLTCACGRTSLHHLCLVEHQHHLVRISAQVPSLADIQPRIHAILGAVRLVWCQ